MYNNYLEEQSDMTSCWKYLKIKVIISRFILKLRSITLKEILKKHLRFMIKFYKKAQDLQILTMEKL